MDPSRKHICPTCGKGFRVPAELKRHISRKNPCTPIVKEEAAKIEEVHNPNKCKFCNRMFSRPANVKRHQMTSCPIAPTGRNGQDGMELLYQHVEAEQARRLADKEAEIEELERQIEKLRVDRETALALPEDARPTLPLAATVTSADYHGKPTGGGQNVTIHGDHARVVQMDVKVIQQVHANEFGKEGIGYLDRGEVFRQVFDKISAPRVAHSAGGTEPSVLDDLSQQLITHAAMLIYSDPDHPENITCYLPKKTDTNAMVHGRDGWTLHPVNLVFPPMLTKSINLLFNRQPIAGYDGCPEAMAERQEAYGEILRHIDDKVDELSLGAAGCLRPILVRNESLLREKFSTKNAIGASQEALPLSQYVGKVAAPPSGDIELS